MNIKEFINKYENHPILFIGTGISLRYLEKSYSWDSLLSFIAFELMENDEYYYDLKEKSYDGNVYNYEKIALYLENDFNEKLKTERNGKFKEINDLFYELMKKEIRVSRFKIYISELLKETDIKIDKKEELESFKKVRKNVGSIITTNYDKLIEEIFEFIPLIGNDILLSNPYGSVYKIHGCISHIENIIITEDDYISFDKEYDLIRAQLLSLFIHNPIIFLGYSIEDNNIRKILKTIFSYVNPISDIAEKIKKNFLLIEYEKNSTNEYVTDYDINMDGTIIRINKLKTDNYKLIYDSISNIHLPISAMDVRKVQNIVKDIYSGGDIKVTITEDLDNLKNSDKVLAIGSSKTIKYEYRTTNEIISDYFKIIDESNYQLLSNIDKLTIQKNQYFPMYGFYLINNSISCSEKLMHNQTDNIDKSFNKIKDSAKNNYTNIIDILNDENISDSNKVDAIFWGIKSENIPLDVIEIFLKEYSDKNSSSYKKMLCAYDIRKYKE